MQDGSAPGRADEEGRASPVRPGTRIQRFLQLMNDRGASDLHLAVGQAPMLRVHGQIEPIRLSLIHI